MSLSPDQVLALDELQRLWPDRAMVIIGATALGFYLDMTWRKTADVDLLVAMELDEFPGKLTEQGGWTRHPRLEHRFFSPQGCQLDILPAGEELLRVGTIEWESGHTMSLAGLDLAFSHAENREVAGGRFVQVASPSVVAVLKMAAYLDRPQDRLRDLEDLAHLLEHYVDEDSARFWDEAMACGEFDLAPAYLLGRDIGQIAAKSHHELIGTFISHVGDEEKIAHAQMERRGPRRWVAEEQPLSRRLQAFVKGLESAKSP